MKMISLHLKSDGTTIQVPISSKFEGSAAGTTVWIKIESDDVKTFVVKEEPDEINRLIEDVKSQDTI